MSREKSLLLSCKEEFLIVYKFFSDKKDFSCQCTRENLSLDADVPEQLVDEFVEYSESIRKSITEQMVAKEKNLVKIENLLAQIRFIKLRFRLI